MLLKIKYWMVILIIQFGIIISNWANNNLSFQFQVENFDCEAIANQKNDSTIILKLSLTNKSKESIYILANAINSNGTYLDEEIIGIDLGNWITDPAIAPWMNLDLIEIAPKTKKNFKKEKKGKIENLKEIQIHGCQIIESKIENKRIKKKLQRSIKRGNPQISIKYFYDEQNPNSFGNRIEIKKIKPAANK